MGFATVLQTNEMISPHSTVILFTVIGGCVVLSVVLTFTVLLCTSDKSTDAENQRRRKKKISTKRGELYRHPLFVSAQRQNLSTELEPPNTLEDSSKVTQQMSPSSASREVQNGSHNGDDDKCCNALKVENGGIEKNNDNDTKTKAPTNHKLATKSSSMPDEPHARNHGPEGNGKKKTDLLRHAVTWIEVAESQQLQDNKKTHHERKKNEMEKEMKKVNTEPIIEVTVQSSSTTYTPSKLEAMTNNITLTTNSAYGSSSSVRPSPDNPSTQEVNNTSLMMNKPRSSNLRPNSYIADIDKELVMSKHVSLPAGAMDGMLFERNPSYLQLPNDTTSDVSSGYSDDNGEDEMYSYVPTTHYSKNSTWPAAGRNYAPVLEATGIYVELDIADNPFQKDKNTPFSNAQLVAEENPYY